MKKAIIIIAIVLALALLIINIEPILNYASNTFLNIISEQFEKEEAERIRRMENGELVRGKDTALIWENKYEIWHHLGKLLLSSEDVSTVIFENISEYKVIKETLYIVADEGYAVIDNNNLCRVFVTVSDEIYSNGYTKDENGNRAPIPKKPMLEKSKNIQFLSSYDQFTEDERNIFEKLSK